MKGTDLLILKAEIGIQSNAKLAQLLGVSEKTIYNTLTKAKVPLTLSLAAAALRAGLEPYTPPKLNSELQLKVEADSASTLRWLELQLYGSSIASDATTNTPIEA
jgi:hypothetical protein